MKDYKSDRVFTEPSYFKTKKCVGLKMIANLNIIARVSYRCDSWVDSQPFRKLLLPTLFLSSIFFPRLVTNSNRKLQPRGKYSIVSHFLVDHGRKSATVSFSRSFLDPLVH